MAVGNMPHRYRNLRAIWNHTLLPATQQKYISAFTQLTKAGTRFMTPEGYKAELT